MSEEPKLTLAKFIEPGTDSTKGGAPLRWADADDEYEDEEQQDEQSNSHKQESSRPAQSTQQQQQQRGGGGGGGGRQDYRGDAGGRSAHNSGGGGGQRYNDRNGQQQQRGHGDDRRDNYNQSHSSQPHKRPEQAPTVPPFRAAVFNLSYKAHEEDVADFFNLSKSATVDLVTDRDGKFMGQAHIEVDSREELEHVLLGDGETMMGRQIKVHLQNDRQGDRGGRRGESGDRERRDMDSRGGGSNRGGGGFDRDRGDRRDDRRDDRRGRQTR